MAAKRSKVLFLCTGNACRSQMAEAILRHVAGDRFEALSAGSHPAGFVHPLAIEAMRQMNIPLENQTSKSWDEFSQTAVDATITLCDDACDVLSREAGKHEILHAHLGSAGEGTLRPGSPITAHWSLPDPVFHPGSEEERLEFALRVAQRLRTKIEGLIKLDFSADRAQLAERLAFLGGI